MGSGGRFGAGLEVFGHENILTGRVGKQVCGVGAKVRHDELAQRDVRQPAQIELVGNEVAVELAHVDRVEVHVLQRPDKLLDLGLVLGFDIAAGRRLTASGFLGMHHGYLAGQKRVAQHNQVVAHDADKWQHCWIHDDGEFVNEFLVHVWGELVDKGRVGRV